MANWGERPRSFYPDSIFLHVFHISRLFFLEPKRICSFPSRVCGPAVGVSPTFRVLHILKPFSFDTDVLVMCSTMWVWRIPAVEFCRARAWNCSRRRAKRGHFWGSQTDSAREQLRVVFSS